MSSPPSSPPKITLCSKGCGRPAFGRFTTCCVKCTGNPDDDSTHNLDCACKAQETLRRAVIAKITESGQHSRKRPRVDNDSTDEDEPGTSADGFVYLGHKLSYTWRQDAEKVYIMFKCTRKPQAGSDWYDFRTTRGYFNWGPLGLPPLVTRALNVGVEPWHGGYSFRGGALTGGPDLLETSFVKKEAGKELDFILSGRLTAASMAAADAVRRIRTQEPKALLAFLDLCGERMNAIISKHMITNKATSFDLALTTPGGTQFTLDIRMGGVFWSEARIKARLGQGQHRDVKSPDKVNCLKEFVGLEQDGIGTFCRVTLAVTGSDLTAFGADGFEIDGAATGAGSPGSSSAAGSSTDDGAAFSMDESFALIVD